MTSSFREGPPVTVFVTSAICVMRNLLRKALDGFAAIDVVGDDSFEKAGNAPVRSPRPCW